MGLAGALSLTCGSVELSEELQKLLGLGAPGQLCGGRREFEACGHQFSYCAIVAPIILPLQLCLPDLLANKLSHSRYKMMTYLAPDLQIDIHRVSQARHDAAGTWDSLRGSIFQALRSRGKERLGRPVQEVEYFRLI